MAKKSSKKIEKKVIVEEITEDKEKVIVEEIEEETKKEQEKGNDKKKENGKLKFTMLVIQFFLSIVALAFAIVFFFNRNIVVPFQISLSLTMFVMGINNLLIYKRKVFTFLYFLIGLVLLILAVLTILGV